MKPKTGDEKKGSVMLGGVLPGAWHRHAGHLRHSAELLWEPLDRALALEPPFSPSDLALWYHAYAFLLVAGAALEAMIKAAAIQAHFKVDGFKQIVTEHNQLERWLTTHNLKSLAERAKMDLAEDEQDQLDRFTRYVVWAGSYPTQINLNNPRPDAIVRFDFNVSNFDRVWFDRLYERAEQAYLQHGGQITGRNNELR